MVDQALRAAIETACHGEAETRGGEIVRDLILSEFVVVAYRQGWDSEGEPVTQVVVMPDGGAEHRIIGLLRNASIQLEADALDDYRA